MDSFTPAFPKNPKQNETPQGLSELKFFSLALVVETPSKFPSSVIKVTPIESLSTQDSGGIKKTPVTYEQIHPEEGGGYNAPKSIDRGNTIEAEWMPLADSNRDTAPCVYKDETVLLLKYADVQKYYWITLKRQPQLRRKEMVRWGASNETEPLKEYTKATTYYNELNALDRYFEISSPTIGEERWYRIRGDVARGSLEIVDEKGNGIHINSDQEYLTIKAEQKVIITSKTSIELNSPNVIINSDNIQFNGPVKISETLQVAEWLSASSGSAGSVAARFDGDVSVNGHLQTSSLGLSDPAGQEPSGDKSLTQASIYVPEPYSPTVIPEPSNNSNWDSPDPGSDIYGPTAPTQPSSLSPALTPSSETTPSPVKESVATASQLGGQFQDKTGALAAGVQGLSTQVQGLQKSVAGNVNQAVGTVQNTLTQVRTSVMDPVNQVSREVLSLTNAVTGQTQSVSQDLHRSISASTQPFNQLSQSLTGKSLAGIDSVNQRLQPLHQGLNSPALSSATSSARQAVGKANYLAQNLNQDLTDSFRAVTDTVASTQSQTQQLTKQLNNLADTATAFSSEHKKALQQLR